MFSYTEGQTKSWTDAAMVRRTHGNGGTHTDVVKQGIIIIYGSGEKTQLRMWRCMIQGYNAVSRGRVAERSRRDTKMQDPEVEFKQ